MMAVEDQQPDLALVVLDGGEAGMAPGGPAADWLRHSKRSPQWGRATPEPHQVEDLLRQLLDYLQSPQSQPLRSKAREGSQDVFDLELDGHRLTVMLAAPAYQETTVTLSPREQEIVRLVAKGLPNKTIASVLDISPWTIAAHLRRVFAKLEVSSRAEMIARVMEGGLLAAGAGDGQRK